MTISDSTRVRDILLADYEIVAQIVTDSGCVVLVHNQTSHYLLARCFTQSPVFGSDAVPPVSGFVVRTFEYGTSTLETFRAAMLALHAEVMRDSESLSDDQ